MISRRTIIYIYLVDYIAAWFSYSAIWAAAGIGIGIAGAEISDAQVTVLSVIWVPLWLLWWVGYHYLLHRKFHGTAGMWVSSARLVPLEADRISDRKLLNHSLLLFVERFPFPLLGIIAAVPRLDGRRLSDALVGLTIKRSVPLD
jgi:hypothetical protein